MAFLPRYLSDIRLSENWYLLRLPILLQVHLAPLLWRGPFIEELGHLVKSGKVILGLLPKLS